MSFASGGFWPGTTAALALAILLALAARLLMPVPLALTPAAAAAVGTLVLLGGWMLLSAQWSGAPHRSLVEFDRVLAYAAMLALFASVPWTPHLARWLPRALTLAALAIGVAGLVAHLAPAAWTPGAAGAGARLSFPLTYWNSTGLLAAIGLLGSLHLLSHRRSGRGDRMLGTAGVAVLAPVLALTTSRGAVAALVVGIVAYLALARPDLRRAARAAGRPSLALCLAGVLGAAVAASAPLWSEQQDTGTGAAAAPGGAFDDNGRLVQWRVALEAFAERPLTGSGAGTYELEWANAGAEPFVLRDAHSLYVEVLGELGPIGLALLVLVLGAILIALVRRARLPGGGAYAMLAAAAVAWTAHAGIDWDWEMPAVTLWLFAAGGAALASTGRGSRPRRAPRLHRRIALAVAVLVIAAAPAHVGLSQLAVDRAGAALREGRCSDATAAAVDARAILGSRPEPLEIAGYCAIRAGDASLAQERMRAAMARDPRSWRYPYGLAIVRAAAGLDPRPAAEHARRLAPRRRLARELERRLGDDPAAWPARARRIPLPDGLPALGSPSAL